MMIDKATFSEGEIKCLSLQLIKGVLLTLNRSATPIPSILFIETSNSQICS